MKFLLPIFTLVFNIFCYSQTPLLKQWDYSYGGYNSEFLYQLIPTPDSGFVACGESYSNILYEKSADNWDASESTCDWWLIKCDRNGVKQWDVTLGGNANDFFYNAITTSDGGFLLVGTVNSPVSGNITDPGHGGPDMWVVKLNQS